MRNTQQGFALIELLLVLLLFSGLITLQGYLQRQQQRQLMDLQTSKAALSQAQLLATIYPLSPEPWGVNLPQTYHETVVNEGECQKVTISVQAAKGRQVAASQWLCAW